MLGLAAGALTLSFGAVVHGSVIQDVGIQWRGCSENPLIECGSYQVPFNYVNMHAGFATLALARYKAHRSPRLGTIFANIGGPGGSGVDMIQNGYGEQMSEDTNGQYDIVGWDPRGVGQSTPRLSCGFANPDDFTAFWGESSPRIDVQANMNLTEQKDIDSLRSQLTATESKMTEFGQRCAEYDGGFLMYMGSAAVTRDLVNIAAKLEGPEQKINYWGIGYGSIIASHLMKMFPDRAGRIIIDGAVDATGYSTQSSYKIWSHNSQATFSPLTPSPIHAMAITCLDSTNQIDVTMKISEELSREHPVISEKLMASLPAFYCRRFPVRATERYAGPCHRTTSNPVLVIGNQADPRTPFASPKSVADLLGVNTYLVEQNDNGHPSLGERSDCTLGAIRDYFLQGKLPEKSKFCGTNQLVSPRRRFGKRATTPKPTTPSSSSSTTASKALTVLKKQKLIFLIVAIALAVLVAVLVVALVITCMRLRKARQEAGTSDAIANGNTNNYGQQGYSDPYGARY